MDKKFSSFQIFEFSNFQMAAYSSSIESRVNNFLEENGLSEDVKDEVQNLVMGCIEDMFKHLYPLGINAVTTESKKETTTKKVSKSEKIEDPSTVESESELERCTVGVLNQYCRDHLLKIGGNKKDIKERVWRHLQGESSEDDISSRGKTKTVAAKKVAEKHACSGFKKDGSPCQLSGNEEHSGCWFCYKHIGDADAFLNPTPKASVPGPSKKTTKKVKELVEELDETEEMPIKKKTNLFISDDENEIKLPKEKNLRPSSSRRKAPVPKPEPTPEEQGEELMEESD